MVDENNLEETLLNLIMSAQMEGFVVNETLQSMYRSILKGNRSLEDCLAEINSKFDKGE